MHKREWNRFPVECAVRQEALYPDAPMAARQAVSNAMFGQAIGWYRDRASLHARGIEPMSMNACDDKGMKEGRERRRTH